MERLSIKIRKAELDIKFLRNCKMFNVMPKFLSFKLPYTNEVDSKFISKRLLRSGLNKRREVRKRLCKYFTDFKYEIVIRRSIYIENLY